MPNQLQDVLPDVTQIFQGVQQIPLSRIRPNPDNPGPPITEDQIAKQAVNLEAAPLRNPIKVMPDPANPLAPGVTLHPNNPRLRGDGQPWGVGDFNWVILSGELRYRAFDRLKREAIPANVLNPSPEDAAEIIHTDNDVRERGWFAAYQSIENLIKANPNLTQAQVAARLNLDRKQVNRAISLLPLLNPEARTLIRENSPNSNKGIKGIFEASAFELADIGPGTGLKRGVRKKEPSAGSSLDPAQANHGPRLEASAQLAQKLWPYPAIPPETQELVRRTLAVAIDHQMTQAGVKGLVAWVKAGNTPETYGTRSTQVGPIPSPLRGEGKGEGEVGLSVEPALTVAQSTSGKNAGVMGDIGGWLKALHPKVKKAHQGVWPEVKSLLLSQAKRALGAMVRRWIVTGMAALGVVLLLSPHLVVSLYRLFRGPSSYVETSAAAPDPGNRPAGGQAGVSGNGHLAPAMRTLPPVAEKPKGSKHLQTVSKSHPVQAAKVSPAPVAAAKTIPAWAQVEIPVAKDFADHFYGIGYSNWDESLTYLKAQMVGKGIQDMMTQYFPPSMEKDMEIRSLAQYFSASQPPKVVSGEGDSAELLAQGTVTTVSRAGRNPQTVSTKPVALLLSFRHEEGFGSKIDKVTEVDPRTAASPSGTPGLASPPQGGLGKSIDGTVQDVKNAVNTADEAVSTTGTVKRLLGL